MLNFKGFKSIFHKIKLCFAFFQIDYSFFLTFVISLFIDEVRLYFCFVIFTILHELSHFLVAKKLGYMAKKIRLNFFGASLEGLDDFSLADEIKIVFAGPLFNLFVIILCYLSFWFYPESYNFLNEILLANIALLLFNFLPIYPLDAGRIILAFLTKSKTRVDALKLTKLISICFISALFGIFLFSFFFNFNFTLGFVCVNLMTLLLKESKGASYKRELFARHKLKLIKKGLLEKNVYVKNDTPLYSLFKFIDDYHFVNFFFVDKNFDVKNILSEMELYVQCGYEIN